MADRAREAPEEVAPCLGERGNPHWRDLGGGKAPASLDCHPGLPQLSPRPPSRGPAPPLRPGNAPAGWTPDRRFAPSGVTKGGNRRAVRGGKGGKARRPELQGGIGCDPGKVREDDAPSGAARGDRRAVRSAGKGEGRAVRGGEGEDDALRSGGVMAVQRGAAEGKPRSEPAVAVVQQISRYEMRSYGRAARRSRGKAAVGTRCCRRATNISI